MPAKKVRLPCCECGKEAYLYFDTKYWCTACGKEPLNTYSAQINAQREAKKLEEVQPVDEYELNSEF